MSTTNMFFIGRLILINRQRTKYTIINKHIQEIEISYIRYHTLEKGTATMKRSVETLMISEYGQVQFMFNTAINMFTHIYIYICMDANNTFIAIGI